MTRALEWVVAVGIVTMLCIGCGVDDTGLPTCDNQPPRAEALGGPALPVSEVSPTGWWETWIGGQRWTGSLALAGDTVTGGARQGDWSPLGNLVDLDIAGRMVGAEVTGTLRQVLPPYQVAPFTATVAADVIVAKVGILTLAITRTARP